MEWRRNVDKTIKNHLEIQINEASRHRKAYIGSKVPSHAQLWCAIANLSKQMFDINLKLKYLEKALRDSLPKKQEKDKKA